MLVDMAGSENIEQAGQIGLEAKIQASSLSILKLDTWVSLVSFATVFYS